MNQPETGGNALMQGETALDSLAYGERVDGAGEGRPAAYDGQMNRSLSRCTDGMDSGDNRADFKVTAPTPGQPNDCD